MLKPDMRMIWANSGDVVTPPESKVDLGWILEKPPSQYFNWHLNRTDRMLNHINRRGIPSWSSDTEYHTDGIASYVVGSNGRVYVSVAPSGNNTSPAKDPTTDTTREFWKPAFIGWDEAIPESQITGLTAKLNSKVDKTQRVNTSNGLSGGGALSGDLTIRPTYGTTANTVTQGNDPRLSNSREWSASTVGEAEAKAGESATRRAWTAQRVHQAADGWHDKKFSTIVKNILSRSNAQQIRNDLQLGTSATKDVGEADGNVMQVGAFGLGRQTLNTVSVSDLNGKGLVSVRVDPSDPANATGSEVAAIHSGLSTNFGGGIMIGVQENPKAYIYSVRSGVVRATNEVLSTGNILSSTGTSTQYPMSQAATTAALNQKVSNTTSIIAGTGLEGGGTLSQNRTLSVKYGTTAGTAVEGNDSRVVNALQKVNNLSDVPNKTLARQYLGLGSAATRGVAGAANVESASESNQKVLTMNSLGLGAPYGPSRYYDLNEMLADHELMSFRIMSAQSMMNLHGETISPYFGTVFIPGATSRASSLTISAGSDVSDKSSYRIVASCVTNSGGGAVSLLHTGNILSSTGNSTSYPMTQAAVTSALNTKADTSYVNTELGKKVNSSSVSVALAPNTIPQRDANGRVEVAPPTADGHATNRAYVTTQIGDVESSVTDKMLGVGQSWQQLNPIRDVGTTYTNTTGRPIQVITVFDGSSGLKHANFYVGAVRVSRIDPGDSNYVGEMSVIVPNNQSYRVTTEGPKLVQWTELR